MENKKLNKIIITSRILLSTATLLTILLLLSKINENLAFLFYLFIAFLFSLLIYAKEKNILGLIGVIVVIYGLIKFFINLMG